MYFWHDDYTALYYLQRGEFLWWPFHSLYILQSLFFNLFGLESKGYFLILIGMYILASWLLYYFARLLFKNEFIALPIALIFSTGYVGQESMRSFFGFGFENLLGLNLLLVLLISLLRYTRDKSSKWLLLAIASFLVTMEFAVHRYVGIIIAIIASDFLFILSEKKGNFYGFLKRASIFTLIFYVQLVLRPSYHLLQILGVSWAPHEAAYTQSILDIKSLSRIIEIINPNNLINLIGTFWNLLMPNIYQNELYFYLTRSLPSPISHYWLWWSALPSAVFILVMSFIIFLMRKGDLTFSRAKIIKVAIYLFIIFLWGNFIKSQGGYPIDQISKLNGGIILSFLFLTYKWGIPMYKKHAVFSLLFILSIITPFYLFNPNGILPSYHNYLFSSSIATGFIIIFFVSRELFKVSNKRSKNLSLVLLLFPAFLLFGSHILASYETQREFIDKEGKYSRMFYKSLITVLPTIDGKTVIYIEGKNKELGEVSGNIQRVGVLGSEAVFAVHYNTKKENIFLPVSTAEINAILKSHPDINISDVFAFIFDGQNLNDISSGLRTSLMQEKENTLMTPSKWDIKPGVLSSTEYFSFLNYTLGIYPQVVLTPKYKVSTQLPLKVKINLRARLNENLEIPYHHLFQRPEYPARALWQEILSWEIGQCKLGGLTGKFECVSDGEILNSVLKSKEGKINISWDYNTYGPIAINKFIDLDVILDGKWHMYEFIMHNGGEYLKNFTINYISFPGTIEIGDIELLTLYE